MMEYLDEQVITCRGSEQSWKIIAHPLYQPRKSPWLDLRVFYVRFSGLDIDESTMPKHLTLRHIPHNPDTIIEVNGKRSSMYSESVFSLLRRDRVDEETEEATFVGTDSIKMTGSVTYEIFNGDDLVFSGTLEPCSSNGFTGEPENHGKKWSITCQQEMPEGTGFLKCKQHMGGLEARSPAVDVYVTGSLSGNPVILTKTLRLGRNKHHQKAVLHPIPEDDDLVHVKKDEKAFRIANEETGDLCTSYHPENDMDDDDVNSFYARLKYLEEDDGELSWFNAGVRVGVGIGLGVCLGVGVGVGLLLRSYQTATKSFTRRLL